ncbi:sensor histidine kinase [Lacticaseibacillus sp. N501-2]|uniref:sensor histidine kinase n=1 Tax=Lacticaseibacillus salsurae TaxID=3367729 RepID=UPI0038B26B69
MHDLVAYLRAKALTWAAILIVLLVVGVIVFLEDLPITALIDVLVISAALLVPLIGFDAWRWCTNYRNLKATPKDDPVGQMPAPIDALAAYYQAIITTQNQARVSAQADAKKQAQALSDNFGLWSHQMKTPLAALDLLLQVPPVDLDAARSEVKRIDRYVQMMLTYIKINDVNRDLVLKPVSLTKLLNHVVRDLADLFIGKNLAVDVAPLPTVVSDTQWLRFIFEQLLTNAAKYTQTGGVHIYAKVMPWRSQIPASVLRLATCRVYLSQAFPATTGA